MNINKLLPLILCSIALAGCSINEPVESPKHYTIVLDDSDKTFSPKFEFLLIDSVRVDSPFNNTQMVFRLSDVSFETDYYNRYISEPSTLIESHLPTTLTRSGLVEHAVPYSSGVSTPLVLKTIVTQLYGDFRKDQTPTAVMEIQFILVDSSSVRPTIIFDKKILRQVDLSERTPEAYARGLGVALTQILEVLSVEISQG
ncbi:ABC-type transport auxiliary lipoprotein family protein [Vibrio sp. YYF0003]|uniref:ABC-type transport auxiliary lipoprotein family protein n=1 Tax=Vibrio sp. YYF0003 TaxID=3116646 RepID=UPI002EADFA41|nr:hypothetical protein [Vibrio sp. YYF0003]